MPEYDPTAKNPDLKKALKKSGLNEDAPTTEANSYAKVGDDKIPVAKSLGKLWESRLKAARNKRKKAETNWTEAIRYYDNDQMNHRVATDGDMSSVNQPNRLSMRGWAETENVVFVNTSTMLPMLYAKNPQVEITPVNMEVNEAWGKTAEILINKLISMKETPGVNLKPKARRGVLWLQLTNQAYLKAGWTEKKDSSEQAVVDIQKLSQKYADAKDSKELKEIEGQLAALEDGTAVLSPAGLFSKLVNPFRFYVDDGCNEPDLSDATWVIEEDFLPTALINAAYGTKQDGVWKSTYYPSHILNQGSDGNSLEDEVNNFSLFKDTSEQEKAMASYGYNDDLSWRRAQYTKVAWIWDKTTRRVYLYADNCWEYPIWVWNDPYHLLGFFPYSPAHFHESVEGHIAKGEVTYYLDQQDSINDNNGVIAQARDWNRRHVVFDNNFVTEQQVQTFLKGPDRSALGFNVPEGKKLEDILQTVVPPAVNRPELLDNARAYAHIGKVTGVTEAQQGAQFKTNTTNDAVDFYQKSIDIRTDEKIDALEEWIGDHAWKLLQIAATKMTMQDVAELIGPQAAAGWKQVDSPEELRKGLNLRVVGGSTDKPTSKAKKQGAIQLTQALGQFAGGIPAIAMISLKMIERAFADEVTITEAEWNMLDQSMSDTANAAGAGPGGGGGGGGEGEQGGQVDPEELKKVISELPPEAKQKLEELVQHGMKPTEALKTVMQAIHQQAQ